MSYTHQFCVPDYYPEFSCKCGDCRNTCCSSWGISLTMNEYFTLLGRDCSPALRRILDTAFHLADHPTPERYALAIPRYDGHCRLHGEDGYCMLQRECGEKAISSVCRYYPRAPKTSPRFECSTSASCERTLELLFASAEPLGFTECELTFDLELQHEHGFPAELYDSMRSEAFTLLGERSIPFTERLYRLGVSLFERNGIENTHFCDEAPDARELILEFIRELSHSSAALSELMPELCEYYTLNEDTRALDNKVDHLETKLEKLFINHLFYKGFPIAFESLPTRHFADEYLSLTLAYSLTRLFASAHMEKYSGEAAFIDLLALIFRVIEHSDFDHCAVAYLRRHGVDTPEKLRIITEF